MDACICEPHYFDMGAKLQALSTLLSLLAAVVQLNSAFYHHVTADKHRRKEFSQQSIGKTLSTQLWFQRNGEKTFAC